MFAKTIIDSDSFLDMPLSTQALYFHLSMRADDDGFINNPKKIMRMIGASQNEMELLMVKKFLITFENGVVVIKHWKIHNYIRSDRYKPTIYAGEKALLEEKANGVYQLSTDCLPAGIPNDNQMDTQVRLGKDSIGKDRLGEVSIEDQNENPGKKKNQKHKYGEYQNVLLTDDEIIKLQDYLGADYDDMIQEFSEGIAMRDYKYKSHYLAIRKWYKNRKVINSSLQQKKSPQLSRQEKSMNILKEFVMEGANE
jgi:hypothetical protein